MDGFAPGVTERIGFYVYLLIDPRQDAVFYVGKGTGNRCFAHLAEAHRTQADTVADYEKLARIREIERVGREARIDILRHGLIEKEAFLVESAAIDLLGLTDLENRVDGHDANQHGRMSVAEINVKYGAKPVTIDVHHRVALIRINRLFERTMSDEELYEATRKWWKIGPQRRRLGTIWAPEWALPVFGGVVRAAYRIESWEQPTDDDIAVDPRRVTRWGFRGVRDHDIEALYVNGDIIQYLVTTAGSPTQTPIRYVNCSG